MNATPPSRSPAALIAVRVLLLLLAADAVAVALRFRGADADKRSAAAALDARTVYACPMHAQVVSPVPGDCPICRMALEPRAAAAPLIPPPTSSSPSPARVAGAASGDVLWLSEPGLLRAFDAVSRVKPFELALEMRGSAWVDAADRGVVLLHHDEAALVVPGEAATFYPYPSATDPDGRGAAGWPVRMTGAPPHRWDGATTLVAFEARDGRLAPGRAGTLKLSTRLRRDLVVRDSAILRAPEGPYVLVVSNDRRTLTKRPVEIGNVIHGYATIVSGLREDEWVAAKRTFFLDTERRRDAEAGL